METQPPDLENTGKTDAFEPVGINIEISVPSSVDANKVADKLVELYIVLNEMHQSSGGAGLVIIGGDTFARTRAEVTQ